jgi:hypothetical protein
MLKIIILTISLLAVAVVLLGVKVLFIKGSHFPSGHISQSKELRSRGIKCASHSDDGDEKS